LTLKTIKTPDELDADEAGRLLKETAGISDLGTRIEHISGLLLGRAYVEGSLGGGPQSPEELRISLRAFDCVTFIETVLGLALARTIERFIDAIHRIRYEAGEVDWVRRNHYMVDWARNNEEQGFVKNLTAGPFALTKSCTLGLIAGLPEKRTSFSYFPVQDRADVAELFETGDVMLFVSTKETLDVFHTGFLIEREGRWLLRHATRTAGAIIDQELAEFTSQNKMAGFVLLRPICQR
jgi:N-acetylmuramoyl-L-alanine amidase-like